MIIGYHFRIIPYLPNRVEPIGGVSQNHTPKERSLWFWDYRITTLSGVYLCLESAWESEPLG